MKNNTHLFDFGTEMRGNISILRVVTHSIGEVGQTYSYYGVGIESDCEGQMDFNIARKLGYQLARVIHIGAHKFEESKDYTIYGTNQVFWIDPFPQVAPEVLPPDQKFLGLAIDDVQTKSFRDFQIYEATGFSSFYELESPGSLVRGTPSNLKTVRVEVNSLRNVQDEFNINNFQTLVIDTQGSEHEILRSADLSEICEIIVETSRVPLYTNETKHSDIHEFLLQQGFQHNFDDSDYFYGHGDQYYSRINHKERVLEIYCRSRQTIQFLLSLLTRASIGISRRLSMIASFRRSTKRK